MTKIYLQTNQEENDGMGALTCKILNCMFTKNQMVISKFKVYKDGRTQYRQSNTNMHKQW